MKTVSNPNPKPIPHPNPKVGMGRTLPICHIVYNTQMQLIKEICFALSTCSTCPKILIQICLK